MATSGALESSRIEDRGIRLEWSAEQSIIDNTSKINWVLKGSGPGLVKWYEAGGFKVVIDGDVVYSVSTSSRIRLYEGTVVASGTKTITHNPNGSRTFTAHIEAGIFYYAINCVGDTTFTLDTIPRASTIDTFTCNTSYLNGTLTIKYTPKATFNHKLKIGVGNNTIKIVDLGSQGVGQKTTTATLSSEELSRIYNINTSTNTAMLSAIIETYNNNVKVGESTELFLTLTIPTDVKPTFTYTCNEAVDAVKRAVNPYDFYVKSLSKLDIKVIASGAYGSEIVSISVTVGNKIYKGDTIITDYLMDTGTIPIKIEVTDTRGRIATANSSILVIDYFKPRFNVSAFRINEQNQRDDSGNRVFLSLDFNISTLSVGAPYYANNLNSATYSYGYKKTTDTNYNMTTIATDEHQGAISYMNVIPNISPDYSYDIMIKAEDKFSTTVEYVRIDTDKVLVDYSAGGIAFGKVSEGPGFDCNMSANFRKDVKMNLSNMIKSNTVSGTSTSINANSNSNLVFNIELTGYTPIGIVGANTGNNVALISAISISNNQATINVRNVSNSAISVIGSIVVLYIKTYTEEG